MIADVSGDHSIYLTHSLASLQAFLNREDVTDIYVNRPHEVWIETLGGAIERHDVEMLDAPTLTRLAEQVAALSHQGINREHPLLSGTLPSGARVQIIAPPATRGALVLAIRKHLSSGLRLADYVSSGAFDKVSKDTVGDRAAADQELIHLRNLGDFAGLLKKAVNQRRNILVSGGTSSGKTTFLNALIREIAPEERLIFIEDTPELELHHANAIGLIVTRSALGESVVTMEDLLNASLRMRPDRIILGELRGAEAFTFLRAINTGHPGSMTTVHADSSARAIEQIALLVLQTGTKLDRESVLHYVRSTVDIFVQLGRTGGRRHIVGVEFGMPE
ncbi:MAG: P-type DNA transfer ATPase VirB11 [Chakrabartia sp.]